MATISGLVSGMDTNSIIQQLMALEKQPYDKLDVKKQTEQLKLQAYQAVNSMLLKFRNSVTDLSTQSLWKSKLATSSNEKSLTATASQYAVNGNYTFRVAQLATATQYMSKGVADTKAAFATPDDYGNYATLGTIEVNSAKSRVDNSAKLESLNGGKGVYRGSIRITDSRGNSGTVDLSGAETINDVVSIINNNSSALVRASVGKNSNGESVLVLEDDAGGTGGLKVQNVGTGTTAKDLGLTGTFVEDANGKKTLTGSSLYYLGRDTYLSELRDGLGIEEGSITIYMNSGGAGVADVKVDTTGAKTVGELLDKVNKAIGESEYKSVLGDLTFGLNDLKNGFQFTGGTAGSTYIVYNSWELTNTAANPEIAGQLGFSGSYLADANGSFQGERVLGDADSPLLKNLVGVNGTGIGAAGEGGQNRVPVPGGLSGDTKLSYLNNGNGLNLGAGILLTFYEGQGSSSRKTGNLVDNAEIQALLDDPNSTVNQLLAKLNAGLAAAQDSLGANNPGLQALEGMSFELAGDGSGIVLTGASAAHKYNLSGELATSLGLAGDYVDSNLDPASQAALDALYAVTDLRNGNQNLIDTTPLGELKDPTTGAPIKNIDNPNNHFPVTPPVNFTDPTSELISSLTPVDNQFSVTIGGTTYDLGNEANVQAILADSSATLEDLVDVLNTSLITLAGTGAPQLAFDNVNNVFAWTGVDPSQDFSASGGIADNLGTTANFDHTQIIDGVGTIFTLGGTDDFVVKIGGNTYNLQAALDSLPLKDSTSVVDFFNAINDELAQKMLADGIEPAPFLTYDWLGTGFQWRNLDVGQSFEVTGAVAGLFGLTRNYDPTSLNIQEIQDQPRSNLNPTLPGYSVGVQFDGTNQGEIYLKNLNGGKGLSLLGDLSDTLDLKF
ncbi:MAG: hypothetical protein LBU79_09325, partial [Planctomycetota bacterium]|nr:hypothetical protein [Planctomycetota bacterium]